MHIVYICNELPPAPTGGIGTCVNLISHELARVGHNITVVGIYNYDYGWDIPGVKVIPIYRYAPRIITRFIHPLYFKRVAIYRTLKYINKINPINVIEWPDYEGLYFKPIPGVTNIVRNSGVSEYINSYKPNTMSRIQAKMELNTLRSIDNWIGVSEWSIHKYIKLFDIQPKNSKIIYNPIDAELFAPINKNAQLPINNAILFSGSLRESKGVFQLLYASNIFLKKCTDARLLLIGRADPKDLLIMNQMIQSEIRNRIIIAYPVSQSTLSNVMRQSTIFAMPSYMETFGNVWAEAMASGLPIIGSTLSCGPEIVPDKIAGLLVDPNNIEQIADPMCQYRVRHFPYL